MATLRSACQGHIDAEYAEKGAEGEEQIDEHLRGRHIAITVVVDQAKGEVAEEGVATAPGDPSARARVHAAALTQRLAVDERREDVDDRRAEQRCART